MSAPKNINPGCGSSRGFQFPVCPVSVWGEAASELEVGVKKLLCAGAAWIKPFFFCSSLLPRGAGSPSPARGLGPSAVAELVPARGSVSLPTGARGLGQAWGSGEKCAEPGSSAVHPMALLGQGSSGRKGFLGG